jgi:hypothetical protein
MSQKADLPAGTPKSYSSINLSSTFGEFDMDHLFNRQIVNDCNGTPYLVGDAVGYHQVYAAGGIGFSRKKYYNEWKSTLVSLNCFAGKEKENVIYNPYDFSPPNFKNMLWSINPQIQFDTRGIGLGFGLSFGNVSYDKDEKSNLTSSLNDYTPQIYGRDFSVQTRLRLFRERYFFLELLGGYDASAVGEYTWQALAGSRFNTNKFMMKAGVAMTKHSDPSFVVKGEVPLGSNLFLSPQFTIYSKNDSYANYAGGGYRAVIGLEYRFYDNDKGKLNK